MNSEVKEMKELKCRYKVFVGCPRKIHMGVDINHTGRNKTRILAEKRKQGMSNGEWSGITGKMAGYMSF